ncbi:MAG: MBL fold metallo-hydrolase [Candidatus Aenigmarchaeota archaeon]|nr:MBL fold metallo-hydrolase [Candidatus Aenigmarchaeota archaeon]
MASVKILRPGYFKMVNEEGCEATCTISLITDAGKKIIVDTGNVGEGKEIKKALKKNGLSPSDIDYVIITHYHPDHIGNNSLFENATFVDGVETFVENKFHFFEEKYTITKNVTVIRTPGHYSNDDCSVIVKTDKGTIAIAGDLFWSDEKNLPPFIFKKKLLMKSRAKIVKMADFIIPGHGDMFKVSKKK